MNTSSTISETLTHLGKSLKRISEQFSSDAHDAQDIYQAICEYILKYSSPTDSDSKILTMAKWAAQNHIRNQGVYNFYVGEESDLSHTEDEDDADADTWEFIADRDARTPTEIAEQRETRKLIEAAIAELEPRYAKVVTLMLDGYSPAEISRKMGISRAAISQRMDRIRGTFTMVGLSA